MKKFRLRQEINMTKEDGTPLKELSVDVWISTEGVDAELIKDMFQKMADNFAGLVGDINFTKDEEPKLEFVSDDVRKRW